MQINILSFNASTIISAPTLFFIVSLINKISLLIPVQAKSKNATDN